SGGSPAATRRARRRRHGNSWLQRNALSIAAISFLGALLGLGFGLVQVLTRPDPASTALAIAPPDQGPTMVTASVGNLAALALPNTSSLAAPMREIQAAARVIEPNYTVEAGDPLGRIATRY